MTGIDPSTSLSLSLSLSYLVLVLGGHESAKTSSVVEDKPVVGQLCAQDRTHGPYAPPFQRPGRKHRAVSEVKAGGFHHLQTISNPLSTADAASRRQGGRRTACLDVSLMAPLRRRKIFLGNFARTGRWGGESRCSENRRSRRSAERHGGRQYRESGWEPGRGRLDSGRDDPAQGRRQPLHRDGKPPTRVGERRERERRRRSRLTN